MKTRKEKDTEYQRKRREKFFAQGLCVSCGKRPHRDDRKTCDVCAKKLVETQRRIIGKMSKEEYFEWCEYNCKKSRKRYHRLKEQGLCVKCGRNEADGGVMCKPCQEHQRELRRLRNDRENNSL